LELLHIEIGSFALLHLLDPASLSIFVTESLVKSAWMLLNTHNIEHCMDLNIPTQRINDILIMQDALQNGITDAELVSINSCRLYLRAIFLSDITDGSGKNILRVA
jgi:hypothetical protein